MPEKGDGWAGNSNTCSSMIWSSVLPYVRYRMVFPVEIELQHVTRLVEGQGTPISFLWGGVEIFLKEIPRPNFKGKLFALYMQIKNGILSGMTKFSRPEYILLPHLHKIKCSPPKRKQV